MTDRLRGTAKLPDLSLHIVDIDGQDINEVALGDLLRVQVRMSDEGNIEYYRTTSVLSLCHLILTLLIDALQPHTAFSSGT